MDATAWSEVQENDAFVVTFDGVDRDARDARELADFSRVAHHGAAGRDFSMGGAGSMSGYRIASPRARIIARIVLCAVLAPLVVLELESHWGLYGQTANRGVNSWSNAQWLAHVGGTFLALLAVVAAIEIVGKWRARARAASATRPVPAAADVPPTDGRFTLRLSPSGLSCSGPGATPVKSIALDDIAGFSGDQRLRVQLADGSVTTLPCCLPEHANHAPLAALLGRKLAEMRASRGGYRGQG